MNYTVHMYDNGRIIIPAPIRRKWNLEPGQDLIIEEEDGIATIMTRKKSIKALKKEIQESIPEDISLVDQLIQERRLAAEQE
ncbi:AbrB/MazE/SpoVT family DNA-binding domain-containing protein [Leptolyngbyaceae cyanobacterium CCMR0082]|uniref:AbrB/MazE/SpoVT family DNA-binding domain-containing protein n=1 Tax=Adonisia turfae CCMR0082 TaxID=2304604 RepID=A0A6M0S9K8_9CYAN|nr:AbrB/MazE/SpoVT family DNA-binding domain-containing protein [Adonisia turfae]NEZ65129.1 AbrB/MazE/SpoVT family DNA-binding domain-containing protein [Adonisia turfae CCMR0082]